MCGGATSIFHSKAINKNVAELIPDARFELFEESGHCLTIEEPERFNRVLRDFIESL